MANSLSGITLGALGEDEWDFFSGPCPVGQGRVGGVGPCVWNPWNLSCDSGYKYSQDLHRCVPENPNIPTCPQGYWVNADGKCEGDGGTTAPATKPATKPASSGGGYVAPKPVDTVSPPVEAGMSTTSKIAMALVGAAAVIVGIKVAKRKGYLRNAYEELHARHLPGRDPEDRQVRRLPAGSVHPVDLGQLQAARRDRPGSCLEERRGDPPVQVHAGHPDEQGLGVQGHPLD